jgi:hypothetical protein
MSLKEIKDYVDLLPEKVNKNVEIVSTKDLGQDFFLHISPDIMSRKSYIPWISHRQAKTEDRTTPRITVSDYLYGCIIGYDSLLMDAYDYPNVYKNKEKQGVYIHEIEFEYCLKPNNKLVYDQSNSNEHWLVTYSQDTKEYKGKIIGKLFVTEITTKLIYGKDSDIVYKLAVEIKKDEGVKFSSNIFLNKGYWLITCTSTANKSYDKDKDFKAEQLTKQQYEELKQVSATMLSINNKLPTFTKW